MTLRFELASLPSDKEAMAKKASLLKRNCFASVFEKYFKVNPHPRVSNKILYSSVFHAEKNKARICYNC